MSKIIGGNISITLEQEADSNSTLEEQYLTVELKDAGGGAYYVIQTEEWAINNPQELIDLLEKTLGKLKPLVEGEVLK